MATGTILLSVPPNAYDPTNPPKIILVNSKWKLLFDDTTDQLVYWTFRMPENYASAPVLKIQHAATSATTGNAGFDAAIMAITPGDSASIDAASFDTDNVSAANATPGTAKHLDETSLTLTNNDSMAAGDLVTLRLNRNTSIASDLVGDIEVPAVSLEYTTT